MLFYTKYTHPTLICGGSDGHTLGRKIFTQYSGISSCSLGSTDTVADAISQLEYDPSVNKTAEGYLTTKVKGNSRSVHRQNWLTVSKHWCNVETENTTKQGDLNLVFATHGEEDKIYPLTVIEIAEAQKKDRNLKIYYK